MKGLEFISFASGSSGNSYMVRTDAASIIVDCGIAGRRILSAAADSGRPAEEADAILITHEHTDHIKSVRMMGRRCRRAVVMGTKATLACVQDLLPEGRARSIDRNETFEVGDIHVTAFPVSHDAADPVGYTFEAGGRKLALLTDSGYVSQDMYSHLMDADALILEANHEVNVLKVGPYPYALKQRILGKQGHLSNEAAGSVLTQVLRVERGRKKPQVLLAHLSHENNTPEQALLTVRNVLFEETYMVGQDLELAVASRTEPSPVFRVE